MALDDNGRKELYRKLLNDPATSAGTKKYSFTQWEQKIAESPNALAKIGAYAISKKWANDLEDFSNRYGAEAKPYTPAAPAPKPQAAPAAPAPVEAKGDFPKLNAFNQYGQRDLFLKEIQKTPRGQIKEAEEKNWALWPYANEDINTQIEKLGVEEVLKNIPLKEKDPRRQKPASIAPPSALIEKQKAYVPEPPPVVGSPEYDAQLQAQYQGMTPTLGATFGGAPAAFETKAQKKQEQISPAFKAQKLAFEDVPIAEEQRRAQRQLAKVAKEQQQAALRGGTGAELKKYRQAESEGYGDRAAANVEALWEGAKNAGLQIFNGLKTVMNAAALNETPMDDYEREYYQQQEFGKMYEASKEAENNFQDELYRLNVSNDVLKAVDEGNYSKVPEASLQTIGNVGISAISSLLTAGGSMYFQTLPEQYREGVEAIAREKGITPEDVIRSGDDAKMTAQTVGGIVAALERAGAGRLSKSIMNKGGYKAVRDFLIRNGFGKTVGRAGGLAYSGSGEFITEYGQQGAQQLGRIAAASEDASQFFKKLPKDFLSKEAFKERFGAGVGGFVGGAGVVGLGRGLKKALGGGMSLDKFSEGISNNELIQNAAKGYEDNIARAEEQGRKPDSFNQKQLKKITSDPEAWVRDEIKYLKQTIESNKNANLDSKVEENSLAKATSLLNQIKAEKKRIEEADIASAEQPVATQEAEAIPAEELQGPGFQIAYAKTREEIPQEYRGTIAEVERPTTRLGRFGPMERLFAYRVPTETIDITAPEAVTEEDIAEEVPFEEVSAEEVVVPPQEEDEDLAAFGRELEAIEQAAPVAPAEEVAPEVVPEVAPEVVPEVAPEVAPEQVVPAEEVAPEDSKIADARNTQIAINKINYEREDAIKKFSTGKFVLLISDSNNGYGKVYSLFDNRKGDITVSPRNTFSSTGVQTSNLESAIRYFKEKGFTDAQIKEAIDNTDEFNRINAKYDSELEAEALKNEQAAPVAQAEEVVAAAPAAPAPKGRKKKAAPVTPAPAAPKKEEAPKPEPKKEKKEVPFKGILSFETAKGSVYTILPNGKTQRFKTATKEQNEPQDLTVFVKFKDTEQEQDFLEGVQRSETSGTKVYVIDKQGNKYDTNEQAAGRDVRLALVKDGKVIDTAETSTTPKIGYNAFDQRRFEKDGEKYRQAHLGNKVVKINEQTKTEAAPSFTSEQSSEAATAFDKGIAIEEKGPDSDFSNRTLYSTDEGKLEIGKRKGRKYYSVLELFVNEESRRKGAATKLLKQAIRDTKGLISSQVSNDVSLEAHYKLGMRAYENGKELSLDEAKKLRQKQTSVNVRFSNAEYEKELHDLYQKRAQELSEIRETRSSNNALQKKYRNEAKAIIDKFSKSSSKDIANQVALVELPSNVKKALIDKDFDRAIELTKSDEDFVEDFYNKKIKELEQKYPNPEITKDVARILKETVAAPSTVDKGQVSGEAKAEPGALKGFTSTQSSEITAAFDKAKTSKGFDKKHGKGAYKALSDITKNFEDIMDKVSEKIKQDCIV